MKKVMVHMISGKTFTYQCEDTLIRRDSAGRFTLVHFSGLVPGSSGIKDIEINLDHIEVIEVLDPKTRSLNG